MGVLATTLKVPLYDERKIAVAKDGSILLSSGTSFIRIIGPDGKHIWRSPFTISKDKEMEKLLKKATIW
jgi:hypothetical protein